MLNLFKKVKNKHAQTDKAFEDLKEVERRKPIYEQWVFIHNLINYADNKPISGSSWDEIKTYKFNFHDFRIEVWGTGIASNALAVFYKDHQLSPGDLLLNDFWPLIEKEIDKRRQVSFAKQLDLLEQVKSKIKELKEQEAQHETPN